MRAEKGRCGGAWLKDPPATGSLQGATRQESRCSLVLHRGASPLTSTRNRGEYRVSMRSVIRHFITRVARTGLLLVFALGAPSIGGAFRCCSSGAHGPGAAHAMASQDAPAADHAAAHHHALDDAGRRGETPPADVPCDCVGHCCAAPVLAQVSPSVRVAEVACASRRLLSSRAAIAVRPVGSTFFSPSRTARHNS